MIKTEGASCSAQTVFKGGSNMRVCTKCGQRFNDKALSCSSCGGALADVPPAEPLFRDYSAQSTSRPFLMSDPAIEPIYAASRPALYENVVIRPQRRKSRRTQPRRQIQEPSFRAAPVTRNEGSAVQNVYAAPQTAAPAYGEAVQAYSGEASQAHSDMEQPAEPPTGRRTIFGDDASRQRTYTAERRGGIFGGREPRERTRTQPGAGRILAGAETALRYIIPGLAIIAAAVIIIINWQNIGGALAHFLMFWIPSFFLSIWIFRRSFNLRIGTLVFLTTILACIFTILYYNIAGITCGILSLLTPLIPLIIIAGALFFLLRR